MAKMLYLHFCLTALVLFAKATASEKLISEPIYSSVDPFYEEKNEILMTVPGPRFRLPVSVVPYHYILQMKPILEPIPGYPRFTAFGKVQISVDIHEITQAIILHSLNLTIDHSTVMVEQTGSGNVEIGSLSYDIEKDFFIIELATNLLVGEKYHISMDFIAPIPEDRLNGMYLDYYDDPTSGERKYVATTLFAPYHSRRAFPNFDEPNFRATYDISLGRHENYHSMSNAELIDTYPMENVPGWHWDIFNTTPSISSYIIAMIVSDFTYEEAPPGSFDDKTVRVYAPYYLIDRGAGIYGAQLTADVISYFEEYFIIKYPLPKMFSIALPHFFFNAMENWGLITYKDPVLLYLQNETTEAERYRINYVVSHELGHQWFGNLVNCHWWAYVWLKEGFASFYAHYGINHTHPELEPWTQFVPNVLQVALTFDATNATHPLENFPETSASVADIYTRIPYEKGASILRMASSFLSESVFTVGILLYVDRFQYKGAVQDDVYQALQEAVDLANFSLPTDVKSIMDTWTRQAGFPLIRTSIIDENTLQLTQEKYILDNPSSPDDTWWVPITLLPKLGSPGEPDLPDVWIPQGTLAVNVTIETSQIIIVNPGATGYYRVMYDEDSFQKIADTLMSSHETIPPVARSQILDDYFSFANAEHIPYEVVLSLSKYLEKENDLAVWKTVIMNIKPFYTLLSDTNYFMEIKAYFSSILDRVLERMDLNAESEVKGSKAILISELLELNCLLGQHNSVCARYIQYYADEWRKYPENLVPVNLQSAIYCGMVKHDDSSLDYWNLIYKIYLTESSSAHRSRLARALSCTENEDKQKWIIEQALSGKEGLHEQDKLVMLKNLASNPSAKSSFIEILGKNKYSFAEGSKSWAAVLPVLKTLSGSINKDSEFDFIEMFLQDNNISESEDIIITTVQNNIEWVEQFGESIGKWFSEHLCSNQ